MIIILIFSRLFWMLMVISIDIIKADLFSRFNSRTSRSTCQSNGGSCEQVFGCLLKQGYMSGACSGFLNVCCIQPASASRRFKENFIFDSGPPVILKIILLSHEFDRYRPIFYEIYRYRHSIVYRYHP